MSLELYLSRMRSSDLLGDQLKTYFAMQWNLLFCENVKPETVFVGRG